MDYFEDYYDEEGNLHIDARKPVKPSKTKNLTFKVNLPIDNLTPQEIDDLVNRQKIIIHHCNIIDDENN